MSCEIVPGAPAYHALAAQLIIDSAEEMCLFIFRGRAQAVKSLADICRHRRGHFGYALMTVAVSDGAACGLSLGYGSEEYKAQQLAGSLRMLLATPLSLWWHLGTRVGPVVDRYLPAIEADVYYISNFAIAEGHRGKGLGTMLLAHVLARAREKGYRRCQLDATEGNVRARAFYRREGMAEVSATDHRDLKERFGLPNLVRMSIGL